MWEKGREGRERERKKEGVREREREREESERERIIGINAEHGSNNAVTKCTIPWQLQLVDFWHHLNLTAPGLVQSSVCPLPPGASYNPLWDNWCFSYCTVVSYFMWDLACKHCSWTTLSLFQGPYVMQRHRSTICTWWGNMMVHTSYSWC